MTDVVSQLEALIETISQRITHTPACVRFDAKRDVQGKRAECVCDRSGRVRSEIARTVERMVHAAIKTAQSRTSTPIEPSCLMTPEDAWDAAFEAGAAAFRATQEHP